MGGGAGGVGVGVGVVNKDLFAIVSVNIRFAKY